MSRAIPCSLLITARLAVMLVLVALPAAARAQDAPPPLQVAVHRTILSKTIQFFGRFDGWRQGEPLPFALSLVGSVEGLNNMREHHQPAVAVVLSRTLGRAVALYATPAFVANTRAADFLTGHDHDHGIGSEEADEHAG